MSRTFHLCITVLSLLTVSACGDSTKLVKADLANHTNALESTDITTWPKLNSVIPLDKTTENAISLLLSKMSLEEKIGQMLQPELRHVTPEDVKAFHIGSMLNGGGTFPDANKYATAPDWLATADSYYQAAMDESDGNSGIPLLWGTDAVHGHNNVIGATLFPHNIGLGAANNPALIRDIARATAAEVAATGIDWIFSPSVATVRNNLWGRSYEGYSEDPAIVKAYAGRFVKGMQGNSSSPEFLSEGHLIATAKHFIGDGGTDGGVDRGDTRVSEQQLFDIHGQGYISALQAGVQTIMVSFSSWQGTTVHGSHYLLSQVLKQRLGFDGIVISDWNGHSFVPGCTSVSCPQAINAGIDLIMAAEPDWKQLYANTLEQVRSGVISQTRIDNAVRRILRVKFRAGLFEQAPSARSLAGRNDMIGAQKHRDLARQAVRESLVLLKNKNHLLPLDRQLTIMVTGDGAHNIGKQSGGWTLSWQGTGNTNKDFPNASSIFDGIKAFTDSAGGSAFHSKNGDYISKPDVAIVVYGENPYAEGAGDITTLEYQAGSKKDLALLKKLKAQGIPVVSIFLSGRPLWVNAELNASDAFVAAWLPGSEGIGIADVIFKSENGEINYDFVGKLSFSWPKDISQTSMNRGDKNYQPLFPYGYGLSYNDKDTLADNLPEVIPAEFLTKAASTQSVATLPINFDQGINTLAWSNFDGGAAKVIANPQARGINVSAKVVQLKKFAGQTWGGSTLTLDGAVDFTQGSVFTMKVWSSRPVPVLFKLEGLGIERTVLHTDAGQWQELGFDFTGETNGEVTAITVIFDNGTMGDAINNQANWLFLIDDIALQP